MRLVALGPCVGDLRDRQQGVWKDAAGIDPCVVNRKVVSYQSWRGRGCPLITTGGTLLLIFLLFCSRTLTKILEGP